MIASPAELSYFLEVAKSQNLSRASERLGISQPSLSTAIKRLEHNIGTPLLIRHKKGVTLTQAGKQFYLHTQALIQSWDDIKAKTLASHLAVQGNYKLGMHPSVSLYYGAKILKPLLIKYPKLEINFVHDISRKITENIINLSLDLAIAVNPIRHPDLVIKKIRQDEVAFWVSEEKNALVDLKQDNTVLICDPNLTQMDGLIRKCKRLNIQFTKMVTTDSLELIADLAANGCGVGLLPTSVALRAKQKLVKLKDLPTYQDEICLIYRDENREVRAIQEMVSMIKKL